MSNDRKQPWGNVVAPIPKEFNGTDDTSYVSVGVAWYNDKDGRKSFSITLEAEPVAWKTPGCPHKLLVQQRQPRNGR